MAPGRAHRQRSRSATADGGVDVTPGDRRDRLGRPARARPRPQHPRAQPLLRHELAAELHVDPLAYAAEQAWKRGIVVVAAAGNTRLPERRRRAGARRPRLRPVRHRRRRLPTRWARPTLADDTVGAYSASARSAAPREAPDFVAPGIAPPGPARPGLVHRPDAARRARSAAASSAAPAPREAAAITSGAVALILQQYPDWTPDQVKALLHEQRRATWSSQSRLARAAARSTSARR